MTALLYVLGVLLFAVGIAASIGLHEVGHLWPAKRFGVKVTQYFIGFGRTLWSARRGETEYGVKAIPLGGYVKLVGMLPPAKGGPADPEGAQRIRQSNTGMFTQLISDARAAEYELVRPGDEDRLFYKLPWWKKVVVMAGGPTVNLLIAFAIFSGIFMFYGTAEPTTTIDRVYACAISAEEGSRDCRPTDPVSPAAEAGIKPGDRIVSFNGEPIADWARMRDLIRDNGAEQAVIVVERDGRDVTLTTETTVKSVVSLEDRDSYVRAGFLGVTPATVQVTHGPVFAAEQMALMTWETVKALGQIPEKVYGVGKAVLGLQERDLNSPVSVVGAGRVAGEVTSDQSSPFVDRMVFLLSLLGGLNLFVGMFNFIPLLPLDGGHIAGALYEGLRRGVARVRGRPDPGFVDVARLLPVAYVMAAVILVMGVVLIAGDIVAPVRLG